MKPWLKSLAAVALTATAATALAADNNVVLYSSNNVDTLNVVTEGFTQKYPGANISVVRAGSGSLMQRIKAESKNPMGDIFWSGGLSTINQFTDYQHAYRNKDSDAVAAQYIDPDNKWIGTNMHVAVLMVNTSQIPKGLRVPETWAELADPRWKGLIVAPDPARSGTAYSTYFGLREVVGDETFAKIVRNMVISGSTSGAFEGPARGEFPVGITMEYAASEYIEGGLTNIKIVYPSEGTMTMPEGMFIIKGAKNLETATKLYDYLTSKECQEKLFAKTYRRPVREDIDLSKYSHLPPMSQIKVHDVDQKASGDQRESFLKLFNDIRAGSK